MQSSGLKRPVSEDEDQAPEDLFPSKDPYISDDEMDGKLEDGKDRTITKTSNNSASGIKGQTLKTYFNLKFCSMPQNPSSKNLEESEMFEIIDNLNYFLTESKGISAHEIVQYVLSKKESARLIRLLYEDKAYALNLKTQTFQQDTSKFGDADIFDERICNRFMGRLLNVLALSMNLQSVGPEERHDTVKGLLNSLGDVISQDYLIDSETILRAEAIEPNVQGTKRFESTADLLLGNLSSKCSPTIPVEVYNPLRQEETKYVPGIRTKTTDKSIATEDKSDTELSKFHDENTPRFVSCQNSSSSSSSCQQRFKYTITSRNILQIITSAVAYTSNFRELSGNQRAYLGLVVNNEYVYLSKIVSDDRNIKRHAVGFFLQPKDLTSFCMVPGISDDIYFQFLPLVLDMSLYSHRMALIFFCKYYLCQWNKMTMNFTPI